VTQFDFDSGINRDETHSLKFGARQAYFGTEDVMPMWVADMDFAAPEQITQALIERAHHPIYGYHLYPDSIYQATQDWFQLRHQWTIAREAIVMCPGVVPTLQAVVEALTEKGDSVVIQPPVYHPFFSVVKKSDRQLIENPLKRVGDSHQMDLPHLEACFKQGAKLLIFCSPHNPVGRVWTQQELTDLIELARQYQVTIVSDEIHADLIYPDYKHTPLQTLAGDVTVITTVSATKTFNIPGLGLSAMVVNDKQVRKAINAVFNRWHINASNPFSIAAFEAGYRYGSQWLDALMLYLQQTQQQVSQFFGDNIADIKVLNAQGTYLLWLDCQALNLENSELRQFFIEKAKVGLNAGYTFGDSGSGYMRLNIAAPRQQVLQACQQIYDALK
jgi:cystathionine beta-lyase